MKAIHKPEVPNAEWINSASTTIAPTNMNIPTLSARHLASTILKWRIDQWSASTIGNTIGGEKGQYLCTLN